MTDKELADTISDMMGQGRTGLKSGFDDATADELLRMAKDKIQKNYDLQKEYGYTEFSRQRANLEWDKWKDKTPENARERNQQLRYAKTILRDPSSTLKGAQDIQKNLSQMYGEDLTQNQTVNLLRIMGGAERRGIRTSEKTITSDEYRQEFDDLPDELLDPEEIEDMVDDFEERYNKRTGLGIPKEEQERLNREAEETINGDKDYKNWHKGLRAKAHNKQSSARNTRRVMRTGRNGKFSESTTHRHRKKSPRKY